MVAQRYFDALKLENVWSGCPSTLRGAFLRKSFGTAEIPGRLCMSRRKQMEMSEIFQKYCAAFLSFAPILSG